MMSSCPSKKQNRQVCRDEMLSRFGLLRHPGTGFHSVGVGISVAAFSIRTFGLDRTPSSLVVVIDVRTGVGAGDAAVGPLLAVLRHHRRRGHVRLVR